VPADARQLVFTVDDVLGHVDEYGDRPATL
jgi:hypothetical protein